jgi:hypothetical protein
MLTMCIRVIGFKHMHLQRDRNASVFICFSFCWRKYIATLEKECYDSDVINSLFEEHTQ